MGRITLRDVAARCGVSICTVSQALRGYAKVSPGTAARVQTVAAELGYEPSEAARIMAGQRRGKLVAERVVVGVVKFNRVGENAAQWRRTVQVLERQANGIGLELRHVNREDFKTAAQMGRVLWSQGVQGLVLLTRHAAVDSPEKLMQGFPWEKFSLVKVTRGLEWLGCHTVRSSAFAEMREALERIAAAGYRRVLVLLGQSQSDMDDWGRHGAVHAFRVLRPTAIEQLDVQLLDEGERRATQRVTDLLKTVQPELVLGFPGWGCYYTLQRAGFRMPADFAYVALPVHAPTEENKLPSVTGVLQDFQTTEFTAALRMLQEEMRRGARGFPLQPFEHVLPVRWQKGSTMPVLASIRNGNR